MSNLPIYPDVPECINCKLAVTREQCGDKRHCGQIPTPPAMNAASPTDMLKTSAETDRAHNEGRHTIASTLPVKHTICGPILSSADPVGQGSAELAAHIHAVLYTSPEAADACALESLSRSKGSATSGEVPLEVIADRQYLAGFDAGFMAGEAGDDAKRTAVHEARSRDIRAALAAKAEQSNTAGAAKGGNTCDLPCQCCYGSGRVYDEQCNDCGGTGNYSATPVAERAAAPASVPEGYKLVPLKLTPKMADVLEFGRKQPSQNTYLNLLAAAPEVAQPAAQGEALNRDVLAKLVISYHDALPGQAALAALEAIIAHVQQWGASQRQEGRREELALHRQLAAEKLRADQGWSRYEEANADRNALRERLAIPAPTAGEPSACPTCPKETPYGPAICGKCVEESSHE